MQGVPNGAFCARVAYGFGDLPECARFAIGNFAYLFPNHNLEFCADDGYRDCKGLQLAAEKCIEFCGSLFIGRGSFAVQACIGHGSCACASFYFAGNCPAFCLVAYVAKSAEVCSLETKDPLAPHVPVVYFGESFVHDSHGININSVVLECLGENHVACGLSIIFCVFRGFFGTIGLSTATIQRKLQT